MSTGAEAWLGQVDLGDPRLARRLEPLVQALVEQPTVSLPEALGGWTPTMGAYRFFANAHVPVEAITASETAATVARCVGEAVLLAVQDTTSLDYTSHRHTSGLGPLEDPSHRGLLLHSTLAVTTRGVPLGLLAQEAWARDPKAVGKRQQRHVVPIAAKESAKWLRGVRQTEQCLGATTRVITVADREADIYEVFALAQEVAGDWLIRARHDRRVEGPLAKLRATIQATAVRLTTTLDVPATLKHPARQATLTVRSGTVVLVPPARPQAALHRWWEAHPTTDRLAPQPFTPLRMGVVWVRESDPPEGVKPLDWLLLTSLPVETVAELQTVVTYYRYRWLIERYHFVLKSGCQVERLRLADADRLQRALAVYALVAWRLLWLTYEARAHPDAPCTVLLDDATWQALAAAHSQSLVLPAEPPDLQTAVRWIAQLGGFLGRTGDGEPGVQTLWRGLARLQDLARMWRLCHPPALAPVLQETCV